jgi:hypothetical protein
MKVFGEVAPYYVTWLLLTMYRVDRESSFNYLCGLSILVVVFEMQVRLKYGTGKYEYFFNLLYWYFPESFTIGENMKLTRELFPLLFQLVLIVCDFTIDAE